MLRENKLKKLLKTGGLALGSIIFETRGPGAVYAMAAAGLDFVFICTEHSAFNLETVADLVAHAHAAGITPLVRIPDLEYQAVTRLLDSGCQSLMVPHVKTGAEMRRFIELAKYYPEGRRGMAIYGGASVNYEDVDQLTATSHANANTLLAVNIETKEAIENLEDILIPGIDMAVVGYQDLSQSYGIPGQWNHRMIEEARALVGSVCKQSGIALIAVPARPEDFKAAIDTGAQALLYGCDVSFIREGVRRAVDALRPLRR